MEQKTEEQAALASKMLKLRSEYMDAVDVMFDAFKPNIQRIKETHGPQAAIDYLYAEVPDCVRRVLAIRSLMDSTGQTSMDPVITRHNDEEGQRHTLRAIYHDIGLDEARAVEIIPSMMVYGRGVETQEAPYWAVMATDKADGKYKAFRFDGFSDAWRLRFARMRAAVVEMVGSDDPATLRAMHNVTKDAMEQAAKTGVPFDGAAPLAAIDSLLEGHDQ